MNVTDTKYNHTAEGRKQADESNFGKQCFNWIILRLDEKYYT